MTDSEAKKIYQKTRNQSDMQEQKERHIQEEQKQQQQQQEQQKIQAKQKDTRNADEKARDEIKENAKTGKLGGEYTDAKIYIKQQKKEDDKHKSLKIFSKVAMLEQLFNKGETEEKELNNKIAGAIEGAKIAEYFEQQKIDDARKPRMKEADRKSKQKMQKIKRTGEKSAKKTEAKNRSRALKVPKKSTQGKANVKQQQKRK